MVLVEKFLNNRCGYFFTPHSGSNRVAWNASVQHSLELFKPFPWRFLHVQGNIERVRAPGTLFGTARVPCPGVSPTTAFFPHPLRFPRCFVVVVVPPGTRIEALPIPLLPFRRTRTASGPPLPAP